MIVLFDSLIDLTRTGILNILKMMAQKDGKNVALQIMIFLTFFILERLQIFV